MVLETVLRTSNTLKVFVIEPKDIRMGVPRVSGTAIDIATVHRPEVGDDIHIGLRNVRRDICIEKGRLEAREHYSSYSNFTESVNAESVMDLVADRESS